MMLDPKRPPRLGRGLNALFGDADAAEAEATPLTAVSGAGVRTLPIEFLVPGAGQPRRQFKSEELDGLAASIRERGVLQPLLVRPLDDSARRYEIIAGERRWRAAQGAGLHEVPVIIRDLSDAEALELALIENVQRQDLNALEEAGGYHRLMGEFHHTQETLAQVVGKSRSHIANLLRLLTLPDAVKAYVEDGLLSAGHARALIGLDNAESMAADIVARGLNVRQTEELVRQLAKPGHPKPSPVPKDADTVSLERDLSAHLGLKVSIAAKGQGGRLCVDYTSLDQLDEVLKRLKR